MAKSGGISEGGVRFPDTGRISEGGVRYPDTARLSEGGVRYPDTGRISEGGVRYPELIPYVCPEWASTLTNVPRYRIKLCNTDTPIHKWNLPSIPAGYSVSIKRDDMTGSTLTGNKVAKLEFLLADALSKNYRHVITCGQLQSNHCRATALAATQLGLKCHLLVMQNTQCPDEVGTKANLLLSRMSDSDIYVVSSKFLQDIQHVMEALIRKIKEDTGEDAYSIPLGGSNRVGMFGCIRIFEELMSQNVLEDFDDVVFACSSGGTAAGLSIANFLTGSKLKIHGILVGHDLKYFIDHINRELSEVNLASRTKAEDIIDFIEGYIGRGYGLSTEEELEFLVDVSQQTGVVLDPVYTGKAARGLREELINNPHRFKGNRILFIHTGGLFGIFDGRMDSVVKNRTDHRIKYWNSVNDVSFIQRSWTLRQTV